MPLQGTLSLAASPKFVTVTIDEQTQDEKVVPDDTTNYLNYWDIAFLELSDDLIIKSVNLKGLIVFCYNFKSY